MKPITENHIEELAITTLAALDWEYLHGLAIAPGAEQAERESFGQIILTERLRQRVALINPEIPAAAREQAVQKTLRLYSLDLLKNNEDFHGFLIEKIKIPYTQDGYNAATKSR